MMGRLGWSLCSQSPYARKVLARCAQLGSSRPSLNESGYGRATGMGASWRAWGGRVKTMPF